MPFGELILKILPLYIVALQGYIAGKLHEIDIKSVSKLMFHFMLPIIFFDVGANVKMQAYHLLLPAVYFLMSVIMSEIYKILGSRFFLDGHEKILSYAAGSVNTTSLGISIATLVFDDEYIRVFMLSSIGFVVYSNIFGPYILSGNIRSIFLLKKFFKSPIIYSFILGIFVNFFDIKLFHEFNNLFGNVRAAYLILGMLLFGLSLSRLKLELNFKFIAIFNSSKLLVSPVLYFILVLLDRFFLHIYDYKVHEIFFIISALPPGLDCIMNCSLHSNISSNEIAFPMLISTTLSLFFISFFLRFF